MHKAKDDLITLALLLLRGIFFNEYSSNTFTKQTQSCNKRIQLTYVN